MGPVGRWILGWLGSILVEVFRECLNSGILPQECIAVWDSRISVSGAVTSAPGNSEGTEVSSRPLALLFSLQPGKEGWQDRSRSFGSRKGWMELRKTWTSGKCPCSWQRVGTG